MTHAPSRGLSLHTKILLGLVLGAAGGVTLNQVLTYLQNQQVSPAAEQLAEIKRVLLTYVMEPVGQVFLRLLFLSVVPLVFASLAAGVAQLGDLRRLGRIGAKTFMYFILTMTAAVTIGLILVNGIRPGDVPEETSQRLQELARGQEAAEKAKPAEFGVQTFIKIVPRNPLDAMVNMDMLAVICFALLVGYGLTVINPERSGLILQVLHGVSDLMVVIINLAMKLAPYGVFALIFKITAELGFGILQQLGWYVFVVLLGLVIQMFGVLSFLVWSLSRLNPLVFFQRVRDVIITAFSTSSSNATLPTSIKVTQEELGVPAEVAGFVLPLGATMNMNGTALFEGVTVVFLAQIFGVNLTLGDQLIVVVMAVLMAVGAAGVPGGSIPLLAIVLTTVGVPAGGIAIILGVDRILDMCRTTLNVVGDITAATFVTRSEGFELLKPPEPPGPEMPAEP